MSVPGRVTACGRVTSWRRVTLTACGRVRQRGDVARACVKRCVEVENRDTYEGYGCIHSRQQRKNVHQPWTLATYDKIWNNLDFSKVG